MTIPGNVNAVGRFVEVEVTLDNYNGEQSSANKVALVVEYDEPRFPKRPPIVDTL
jgi:hypothetical protein